MVPTVSHFSSFLLSSPGGLKPPQVNTKLRDGAISTGAFPDCASGPPSSAMFSHLALSPRHALSVPASVQLLCTPSLHRPVLTGLFATMSAPSSAGTRLIYQQSSLVRMFSLPSVPPPATWQVLISPTTYCADVTGFHPSSAPVSPRRASTSFSLRARGDFEVCPEPRISTLSDVWGGLRRSLASSPPYPAESSSLSLQSGRSFPATFHPSSRRRSCRSLQVNDYLVMDSHLAD